MARKHKPEDIIGKLARRDEVEALARNLAFPAVALSN